MADITHGDRSPSVGRRSVLVGGAATALAPASAGATQPKVRLIAAGLLAPESPKPLAGGGVLLVEMARGTLSRVTPSGQLTVVAQLGGSPNGCAIGPDGCAYVVNNGGALFERRGDLLAWVGPDPAAKPKVQKVDLTTGAFSTLYSPTASTPLKAPNDLVFDRHGGFYFSDTVGVGPEGATGAVYWARADGGEIRWLCSAPGANGVALSPDESRLFVASNKRILAFDVVAPGRLANSTGRVFSQIQQGQFDSMAMEADGGLVVATLFTGGLTLFGPDGRPRGVVALPPEKFVTNVGFGGPALRTAYVTLGQTCKLVAVEWPRPGLRLANQ